MRHVMAIYNIGVARHGSTDVTCEFGQKNAVGGCSSLQRLRRITVDEGVLVLTKSVDCICVALVDAQAGVGDIAR